MPGTRCTLKEFLLYIWARTPSTGEDEDAVPTGFSKDTFASVPDQNEVWKSQNSDQLISKIDGARTNINLEVTIRGVKTLKPAPITGNTESSKLLPNAGDYYDVLGAMGSRCQTLKGLFGTTPLTEKSQKVTKLARDATQAIIGLRWKDMDKFRPTALKRKMGTDCKLRGRDD